MEKTKNGRKTFSQITAPLWVLKMENCQGLYQRALASPRERRLKDFRLRGVKTENWVFSLPPALRVPPSSEGGKYADVGAAIGRPHYTLNDDNFSGGRPYVQTETAFEILCRGGHWPPAFCLGGNKKENWAFSLPPPFGHLPHQREASTLSFRHCPKGEDRLRPAAPL